MVRAVFRVPGRPGTIEGPDKRNVQDALEWARGYAAPAPFPVGTVMLLAGQVYTPQVNPRTGRTVLARRGRKHD